MSCKTFREAMIWLRFEGVKCTHVIWIMIYVHVSPSFSSLLTGLISYNCPMRFPFYSFHFFFHSTSGVSSGILQHGTKLWSRDVCTMLNYG